MTAIPCAGESRAWCASDWTALCGWQVRPKLRTHPGDRADYRAAKLRVLAFLGDAHRGRAERQRLIFDFLHPRGHLVHARVHGAIVLANGCSTRALQELDEFPRFVAAGNSSPCSPACGENSGRIRHCAPGMSAAGAAIRIEIGEEIVDLLMRSLSILEWRAPILPSACEAGRHRPTRP